MHADAEYLTRARVVGDLEAGFLLDHRPPRHLDDLGEPPVLRLRERARLDDPDDVADVRLVPLVVRVELAELADDLLVARVQLDHVDLDDDRLVASRRRRRRRAAPGGGRARSPACSPRTIGFRVAGFSRFGFDRWRRSARGTCRRERGLRSRGAAAASASRRRSPERPRRPPRASARRPPRRRPVPRRRRSPRPSSPASPRPRAPSRSRRSPGSRRSPRSAAGSTVSSV